MTIADVLEQKVLFRLTRLMALFIVVLMMAGLATAAYFALASWNHVPSTLVSPELVLDAISPVSNGDQTHEESRQNIGAEDPVLQGFTLPQFLNPQFAPPGQTSPANASWQDAETRERNRRVLAEWMDGFNSREKQTFVNEMANAAIAAQKARLSVSEAINSYANIKLRVLRDAKAQRNDAKAMVKWLGVAAAAVLLLMAVFSLVLVLLAIERNTRPASAESRADPRTVPPGSFKA